MTKTMALMFVRLVVALMVVECVLATCVPPCVPANLQTHIAQKSFSAVLWSTLVAGAEEEKVEETADKSFGFQIADLQENIFFLSRIHAHPQQLVLFSHHHAHEGSFLALLCVFII